MMIRKAQMEAFSRNQNGNWLREHLEKFFPERCASLEPTGVAAWIQHGKKQASAYGFMQSDEICRYVDFMFALGQHFDVDPRYPWATAILNDIRITDATARLDVLTYTAKVALTPEAENAAEV